MEICVKVPDMEGADMEALISRLECAGQGHVAALLPTLGAASRIPAQLATIDLEVVASRLQSGETDKDPGPDPEPVSQTFSWDSLASDEQTRVSDLGYRAIHAGQVAAVIMSGGQGTRLGYAGPKGCYDIGLPSGKSIFQIHIERLLRVSLLAAEHVRTSGGENEEDERATRLVPVYVMTSYLNDSLIRAFFEDCDFWGYDRSAVYFFEQGLEPCLGLDGKLIVESMDSLSMAPDGNGGLYNALAKSGAVSDMVGRGVLHLHVYGIDNVLTKACDPNFLGLCIDGGVHVGNKVVWRASRSEKVGVSVERGGMMEILEYSEIPCELSDATDAAGKLKYGAGNICNHYLSLAFVRDILPKLHTVYHLAKKKIPYLDTTSGQTVTPEENNGYKFEFFIFDIFPLAPKWLVMEVERRDEFAPVKNAPGSTSDAPEHATCMLSAQAKRWLGAHAVALDGDEAALCEVSPLTSYSGEGLDHLRGTQVALPCSL